MVHTTKKECEEETQIGRVEALTLIPLSSLSPSLLYRPLISIATTPLHEAGDIIIITRGRRHTDDSTLNTHICDMQARGIPCGNIAIWMLWHM